MKRLQNVVLAQVVAGLVIAGASVAARAQADAFPSRPVKLVPCCAGIIDSISRVLADNMSRDLGQPVIVETRPGASGMIAAEYVANAEPDGYTVLIGTNSTHAANQSLFTKVPYDYIKDFAPVTGIAQGVLMLVANNQLPVNSVADLTELARQRPGKLTFGWGSSSTRAGGELYKQLTDVEIVDVPYKTNPQATGDVVGGQINVMWADLVTAIPMVQAGKLKALAVTGDKRLGHMPDIPTMQEAGVPGYEMTWWVAAWTPDGTPPQVIDKLHQAFANAIAAQKTGEYFRTAGLEPFPTTPDGLMKFQMAEHDKWHKLVTAAGIKPQ